MDFAADLSRIHPTARQTGVGPVQETWHDSLQFNLANNSGKKCRWLPVKCDNAHKARPAEIKARLPDRMVAGVEANLRPHRDRNRHVDKCIDCFESNSEQMRHDEHRARGMQIGSGGQGSWYLQASGRRTLHKVGMQMVAAERKRISGTEDCWRNLRREGFAPWKAQWIAAA